MLDAITGLVDQDRILAQRIADEGRSCVIALNKWDAVPEKDDRTYLKAIENIRDHLPSLRWADVVLISGRCHVIELHKTHKTHKTHMMYHNNRHNYTPYTNYLHEQRLYLILSLDWTESGEAVRQVQYSVF
jgi:predicted GTPase